MPNWKKVIVSGSDASLNSLNVTAGVTGSLLGTSSYALNADLLDGKDSTVFATTGSNTFVGNQIVTGSLFTTGSNTLIGSTTLTGSLNVSGSTLQVGNNTLLGNTTLSGSIIISGSLGSQPTVRIYGDTTHNGYIRFDPVITNITQSISASYIYVSGSTNDLYFSQNGNGYSNTTRLRWLEGNLYTGLLNGGLITTQSSTVYQVSSGSGVIINLNASFADNPYPTIQYLNWPNLSASIAPLSASYDQTFVAIDNTSNIFTQGTPYDDGQFNTTIPIGVVVHQNRSTINGTQTFASLAYGWKQRSSDFIRAFGPLKLSGFTLSASGSSTGSLVVASGTAWSDGRNYTIDPNNPSYITDAGTTVSKIFRYRQSGSAAWVYDTNGGAGYPTIDPTQYSNNGVLTAVSGSGINRGWTIQRVYWFPNSATKGIYVYYGNAQYATDLDAIANINIEPFIEAPNTAAQALYLGSLILRNNASFTDSTSYRIIPGGLFRSVGGSGGGGSVVTQTLSGLSDVAISGPTDHQPLAYDTTAAKWTNQSSISASLKGNADTATTASYAVTASFVTGSIFTNANSAASASYAVTASYVATAQTASYVLQAVSSSFASTASYVNPLNQNVLITGSATNALRVKGSGATSATNTLLIENSGNTGSLVVRDDARVGINTTTPNAALDVNGNVIVTGSLTAYSSINIPILPPSLYYPTLTIANTTLQGYQTSGNVFTISNTGYTIEFGSNRGYMIFVSAGHHYFQSGGSNTRMFISSSGRIGIAKSSSLNATLDIIGSQVITGSLEVSAGITGSFLGTSSYATQALTASFYGGSVTSASFASTASYVNPLNQNVTITGASSNSLRVKGSGTTSATNAMLVENSAGTSILNIADNGDSTITGSLAISTLGATLLSLGPPGSEYMVARASGYIGINNTTPTGFLHIRSSQNNGSTWVLLAQNSTAALPGNNNGGPGTILAIRDDYKVSITGSTNISGSLTVTGSANFGGGITGSFLGTASYASMALTASYALSSAGGGGGSTFPYTGSAIISGSLVVTGSFAVITGSTVEFQVLPTGVKIGEISTDVHTVTGSLNVSGSISATTLSGSDDRLLFATSAGIVSASSQTLVSAYINPAGTIAGYLNNTSSWDINGDYSGSAITGTYQGQKHYNSNYFFEAVDDNIWIRLIRG